MRFPSIEDVASELRDINKMPIEEGGYEGPGGDEEGIDVRLQVMSGGGWAVHWGPSDYDQDHRGYWGASSVPGNGRKFNARQTAKDLIEQAKEMRATEG